MYRANLSSLEVMFNHLEETRAALLNEIIKAKHETRNDVDYSLPCLNVQPIFINDSPVYQFVFVGTLPTYKENSSYREKLSNFYSAVAHMYYSNPELKANFEKATLIIEHHYTNNLIRDLDNRNRKYIIDAMRHIKMISDDNVNILNIFEQGINNSTHNCVHILITEQSNFISVYSELVALRKNIAPLYNLTFSKQEEFKNEINEKQPKTTTFSKNIEPIEILSITKPKTDLL